MVSWRPTPHCPVSSNTEKHHQNDPNHPHRGPGLCLSKGREGCLQRGKSASPEKSQNRPAPPPACNCPAPPPARAPTLYAHLPLTWAFCLLPPQRHSEEVQPSHPWVLHRHTGGDGRTERSNGRGWSSVRRCGYRRERGGQGWEIRVGNERRSGGWCLGARPQMGGNGRHARSASVGLALS